MGPHQSLSVIGFIICLGIAGVTKGVGKGLVCIASMGVILEKSS
jgi:F0F1-type ATP synthase membrane subunit c/vacuolar-type H+-ATPase subunit K